MKKTDQLYLKPSTVVYVECKEVHEGHLFTAKEIPSLAIVCAEGEDEFIKVAGAIRKWARSSHSIDCKVRPSLSFTEWISGQDMTRCKGRKYRLDLCATGRDRCRSHFDLSFPVPA